MNTLRSSQNLILKPSDNKRLASLCGKFDEHLKEIEYRLNITISNRSNHFRITGESSSISIGSNVLHSLFKLTETERIDLENVHVCLQEFSMKENLISEGKKPSEKTMDFQIHTPRKLIIPRGKNQKRYLSNIKEYDLVFGIGPAGTGKTYLAVASAIDAIESQKVRRIILVRPAVEAGERLGFLPGDMSQKVDPYLRPIYDALYDMLGFNRVNNLLNQNVIEIAPLAFMRGRSLNESFVILDEAQNTSVAQMKMFLTRIGFGSSTVVTGDITQIDLPQEQESGLKHAIKILKNIKNVVFTNFDSNDVIRHELVHKIIKAYETNDDN